MKEKVAVNKLYTEVYVNEHADILDWEDFCRYANLSKISVDILEKFKTE